MMYFPRKGSSTSRCSNFALIFSPSLTKFRMLFSQVEAVLVVVAGTQHSHTETNVCHTTCQRMPSQNASLSPKVIGDIVIISWLIMLAIGLKPLFTDPFLVFSPSITKGCAKTAACIPHRVRYRDNEKHCVLLHYLQSQKSISSS